jgi:sodium-type flagellar protein MotY
MGSISWAGLMLLRLLTSIAVLLPFASSMAGEIFYGANEHQAVWKVEASRLRCRLSQEIPDYGEAQFVRQAGGQLAFQIKVYNRPRDTGVARVVSAAPAWRHDVAARELGQINYSVGRTPFSYSEIMARRMLLELQQGMSPTFSYQDWADGRDNVRVALSSVNLRPPLAQFLECLDKLFVYGFDYVRSSRLRFAFNSSTLDSAATRRLDEVALYLQSDPSVKRVLLEGRTDNVGFRRYNEALSKKRTNAVRDYLLKKGVAKSKITLTSKGEKQPLASNQTPQGRALNRSVDVTLSK